MVLYNYFLFRNGNVILLKKRFFFEMKVMKKSYWGLVNSNLYMSILIKSINLP